MRKLLYIIPFILAMGLMACEEDVKPCEEEVETAALIGEFPDSLKVGSKYNVQVKYILDNNCGQFDRFDISVEENVFEIKLITEYKGCNCDVEFTQHTQNFEIDVDYPGVYEYRFWHGDDEWDIRTVKIYQ